MSTSHRLEYTPSNALESDSRAGSIARDFEVLDAQLATNDALQKARKLYESGAYCQSYATLNLSSPLTMDIPSGTEVTQGGIKGVVLGDAKTDDGTLNVNYLLPSGKPSYVGVNQICSVGGNPNPKVSKCK